MKAAKVKTEITMMVATMTMVRKNTVGIASNKVMVFGIKFQVNCNGSYKSQIGKKIMFNNQA